MKKIIDILKSKWMINTGKTAILIAIIIAIFLGINIFIQKLDPKDIDLTKEKIFSLSEESKEKIKALPEEDKIQIYMFDYSEQDGIYELITQYAKVNKNITVELINSEERPDLVSKYNIEDGYNPVVIVNGDKYKFFTQYEFFTYDYNTYDSIDITEQRMTNAIIALSSVGKDTQVYMLTGHEELNGKMNYFKTYLELENYEVKTLDLLAEQNVPEDCEGLIIASPGKDFTDVEVNAIKAYIEKGGNILYLADSYSAKEETPKIQSLLDIYGVKIRQDGLVIEQDKNKIIMGTPSLIIPTIENTEITDKVSEVILMSTGKLEFAEDLSSLGVTRTDMLSTSEKSFYRTNLQDTSFTPSEGEKEEVSVVASILEKTLNEEEEKKSKLVVFANNLFATDIAIYVNDPPPAAIALRQNKDLIINSVQYIAEMEDVMTIRKTINITQYTATEAQDQIIKVIIYGLPIIIIIAGIIVWQLRRRKK